MNKQKLEDIKFLRDFIGLELQLNAQVQVDDLPGIFLSTGLVCTNLINIGEPHGIVPIFSFLEIDKKIVCPEFPIIKKTTKISCRKNSTGKYPFIVTIDNGTAGNRILRLNKKETMKAYARTFRVIIQKIKKIEF